MVWRVATECNLWISSWPTVPFAWCWGTKLRFQRSIEKQLWAEAHVSKSKEASRTFIINYPSSMQSLEEMIALFFLISISSLFLSCVILFHLFPFLLYFVLSPYSCLHETQRHIPLSKCTPLFSSTFPEPDCSSLPFTVGESLSLCI